MSAVLVLRVVYSPALPLLSVISPKKTFKFHPRDRLPVPLEFCNHMWCHKAIVVGLQGREISLMIYLFVSIQYQRMTDRHSMTAIAAFTHSVVRLKSNIKHKHIC